MRPGRDAVRVDCVVRGKGETWMWWPRVIRAPRMACVSGKLMLLMTRCHSGGRGWREAEGMEA